VEDRVGRGEETERGAERMRVRVRVCARAGEPQKRSQTATREEQQIGGHGFLAGSESGIPLGLLMTPSLRLHHP
jgi:hypothetical protein